MEKTMNEGKLLDQMELLNLKSDRDYEDRKTETVPALIQKLDRIENILSDILRVLQGSRISPS